MAEGQLCTKCRGTAADFGCSCSLPPVLLCDSCLNGHMQTAGSHRARPLQRRQTSDEHSGLAPEFPCSRCSWQPATRLCLCEVPYVLLCDDCDVQHYQQSPFTVHAKHPVEQCRAVLSGQVSIATFRAKQGYISSLEHQLREDWAEFNAFQKRVVAELDSLEALIRAKKESIVRSLETQKPTLENAVNSALQAISKKRYDDTLTVSTYLDDCILNGWRSAILKDVRMFRQRTDPAKLDELFHFEVSTALLEPIAQFLPVLSGNNVRLYNPLTKQPMSALILDKPTRFNAFTAFCEIGKDTILCCGGNIINEVYEVNVKTGHAEKMANMSQNKGCVGLWNYQQEVVFAFGGWNGNSMDCAEKYSLSEKAWTALRSMCRPSHWVSVCQHSSGLYFGGEHFPTKNATIQHFSLVEESFSLLYTIPAYTSPLLFCVNNDLYVIRQGVIEKADLSHGPIALDFKQRGVFEKLFDWYWAGGPVKCYGKEFVGVLWATGWIPVGLFSFNYDTEKFIKHLDISY